MKSEVRRTIDAGKRALAVLRSRSNARAAADPAVDALGARVTEATKLAAIQRSGQAAVRDGAARRRRLRGDLQRGPLAYLVEIGEVAGTEIPGLRGRFNLPSAGATDRVFFGLATGLFVEALANRELFVWLGFADDLFAELAAQLDQYANATEQIAAGRKQQGAAGADLEAVAREIRDLIERLGPEPEVGKAA
jgi:hypothetical protein